MSGFYDPPPAASRDDVESVASEIAELRQQVDAIAEGVAWLLRNAAAADRTAGVSALAKRRRAKLLAKRLEEG